MEGDSQKTLKRQLLRFLITGASAVLTDFTVYYTLIHLNVSPAPAKATSFLAGTILAYLANKYWTFESRHRSTREIVKFAMLYSSTLFANTLVNHVALIITHNMTFMAFLAATGTSTVLNFVGQKLWVFSVK